MDKWEDQIDRLAKCMFAGWGHSEYSWKELKDPAKAKFLAHAEWLIDHGYYLQSQVETGLVPLDEEEISLFLHVWQNCNLLKTEKLTNIMVDFLAKAICAKFGQPEASL